MCLLARLEDTVDTLRKKSTDAGNDTRDGLATALKAYDQTFRPFMNQVQAGLDSSNSWSMPSTAFGIVIVLWVLQVLAYLWVDPIARWFLKETINRWGLPEYEEMQRAPANIAA